MVDLHLFEVAQRVWLERARRRPFAALSMVVVMSALTTAVTMLLLSHVTLYLPALTGSHDTSATLVLGSAISHVAFLLIAGIGVVSLCDWIIRVETPGFAARSLRYAWCWKNFEGTRGHALPHGQIALFALCSVASWPGPLSLLALLANYALWSISIWRLSRSQRLHIVPSGQMQSLLEREAQRSQMLQCFAGITTAIALLFHIFIVGALLSMALALSCFLSVPAELFADRFAERVRSRIFELALRGVPALLLLLMEAGIAALWGHTPLLRNSVDPLLAYGLAAGVFVAASGFCAGRLFEQHCRYGPSEGPLTAQGAMQAILSLGSAWRTASLRGLGIAVLTIETAAAYVSLISWLSSKVPWFALLAADAVGVVLVLAAAVVAILANTMPYSSLCDVPRQQSVLSRIERSLNERMTL